MKKWDDTWINISEDQLYGGQGRIYFVRKIKENSDVFALKELKNSKRSQRFENEIQLIKSLPSHPNVIKIIDSNYSEADNKYYYVMPKADSNLEILIQSISANITEIERLYLGILHGAIHLHKNGIIHRDLKPSNILLYNGNPIIADFGVSISLLDNSRLTPEDEVVGPRFYMAPELEDGRLENIDYRCDIYSLGKILYFLLSNGRIFNREKFRDKNYYLENMYLDERYTTQS